MEIFTLLEALEDILERSKTVPFTDKGIVSKNEILDIIKEIRLKLPDELKQAKWIKEERERIITEAQKDADDIVKEAENRIISMIDEQEITKKAYEKKTEIIATANDIIANPRKYSEVCHGKKLATLFFEPSTRTRLSFEAAMYELGGHVLGFSDAGSSSATKGESVADTTKMVNCYADIIAMRHPKEGAPLVASMNSKIPVINAGDGGHNHPTQTLTDLLTISRKKGRLKDFTIGFCGDLKFGRTVHSLITALARYTGVKIVLISPDELKLPSYIKKDVMVKQGVEYVQTTDLEAVLPELDVLYMTRVQKERFLSEEEYIRLRDSYILTAEKLKNAKDDLIVLHPLPRVNEISVDVDDDPRACYFEQALNGKFVRMALIMKLLGLSAE